MIDEVTQDEAIFHARELLSVSGDDESYNRAIIEMIQSMFGVSESTAKSMINEWSINPYRRTTAELFIHPKDENISRWECITLAVRLLDVPQPRPLRRSHPSGYQITDYSQYAPPRSSETNTSPIEVLFLARKIYSWIKGEDFEPSTDEELREELVTKFLETYPHMTPADLKDRSEDLISYIRNGVYQIKFPSAFKMEQRRAENARRRQQFEGVKADDGQGHCREGHAVAFTSKDVQNRVHNLLQLNMSNQESSDLIHLLYNAGIMFTSTDETR